MITELPTCEQKLGLRGTKRPLPVVTEYPRHFAMSGHATSANLFCASTNTTLVTYKHKSMTHICRRPYDVKYAKRQVQNTVERALVEREKRDQVKVL